MGRHFGFQAGSKTPTTSNIEQFLVFGPNTLINFISVDVGGAEPNQHGPWLSYLGKIIKPWVSHPVW